MGVLDVLSHLTRSLGKYLASSTVESMAIAAKYATSSHSSCQQRDSMPDGSASSIEPINQAPSVVAALDMVFPAACMFCSYSGVAPTGSAYLGAYQFMITRC